MNQQHSEQALGSAAYGMTRGDIELATRLRSGENLRNSCNGRSVYAGEPKQWPKELNEGVEEEERAGG